MLYKIWYHIKVMISGLIMMVVDSVPGLSGAVFISIGGTMQKIWTKWEDIIKPKEKYDAIKAILFYAAFGIGATVGMLGFANIISLSFENIPTITFWFFLAASFGGALIFLKSNKKYLYSKTRSTKKKIISFITGFALIFIIIVIMLSIQGRQDINDIKGVSNIALEKQPTALALLFISGYLSAFAMFTPGLSGGLVLLVFNSYNNVYSALMKNPLQHKTIFIIYAICVVAGIITAIFTLDKLIKKIPTLLNWILFGFVLGSLLALIIIFDIFIPAHIFTWLYIGIAILTAGLLIYLTLQMMDHPIIKKYGI